MNTEQKIDAILSKQNEQNIQLAKFIVRQEQHGKDIDDNKAEIKNNAADIKELTALKNKSAGVVIAVSFFVSGITALVAALLKH